MKTKEAIEFMNEDINYVDYAAYKSKCIEGVFERETFGNKRKEVVKLLLQGGKYETIVEDIEQYINDRQTIEANFCTNGNDIIDLIKWLKRKYFPPIKKTITIDFESEDKDVVNSCINLLKKRLEEYSESIHIDYKIKEEIKWKQ